MLKRRNLSKVVPRLVAVGLIMNACSHSGSDPGPTATVTPTTSGTAISTAATGSSGDPAAELQVSSEQLTPGTYRRSDFQPKVTFAVSGPWYAVQSAPGFFDIQQDVGSPNVIAVQFANVAALYGAGGAAVPLGSAADATAIIESNPDLTMLGNTGSRMGGREGFVVEVENATQAPASVLQVPAGALTIDPGRRLWIAFFDTGGEVLAIMVGGSAEHWEEALLAAEPVLETVMIGD